MASTLASSAFLGQGRHMLGDAWLSGSEIASTSCNDYLRVACLKSKPTLLVQVSCSHGVHKSSREGDLLCSVSSCEEWWRKPAQRSEFKAPSAAAAEAFFTAREFDVPSSFVKEKEHIFRETPTSKGKSGGVPVYVMLPLDSVNSNNQVSRKRALNASLLALKSAGVEGVMMDVWWGIVEKDGPLRYNWSAYRELMEMVKKHGLKIQAVMSFHQCGGNVGDSCSVPLPPWVLEEMHNDNDIVYTDRAGRRNPEYLSLGCDTLPVLKGRTPVQAYADYMRSFRDTFKDMLGDTIVEVQVGMGPAGELRYPGYPERDGIWRYPGIGEFQCYDKYMLASLKAAAHAAGKPAWGHGGPFDAGSYKQWPEDSLFFKRDGGWNTPYGQFFLNWYSGMLLDHGERILTSAEAIFRGTPVRLSAKVAGIHWHYGTRSHPPELTAGYYNTRIKDGYLPVARMFGRHGVTFNFTCFEMRDIEQPPEALCSPEGLLIQVVKAAKLAGIPLAGENALPRYDESAYEQIVNKSRLQVEGEEQTERAFEPMCTFTFLRMSENLFHPDNWRRFVPFVRQMAEGRTFQPWEEEHRASEQHVHATRPLIQEAAAALV